MGGVTRVLRRILQLQDVNAASIADGETLVWDASAEEFIPGAGGGGGGGAPSGPAGGVLGGTYPNPAFAADMATQAELDAHVTDSSAAHAASAVSFSPTGTIAATDVQAAIAEVASEAVADLAPAVILAPASSARNVIQPTAGSVIAAVVKAHAAQTVDIFRVAAAAGTGLGHLRVGPGGGVGIGNGLYDADGYSTFLTQFVVSRANDGYWEVVGGGPNFTPGATESVVNGFFDMALAPTADNPDGDDYNVAASTRFLGPWFVYEMRSLSTDIIFAGSKAAGSGAQVEVFEGHLAIANSTPGSTGDVTQQAAARYVSAHYGTGLRAILAGIMVQATVGTGSGAVTNAYGVHVANTGGLASVATSYGLYVAAQSGSTNPYGIYVAGGKSVFVDSLILGKTAAPADADLANNQGAWYLQSGLPVWKGKNGAAVVTLTPYGVGGTDVALADGGTGASLADPNADRIMFWDDSAGAVTWLTAGTNLTITDTTIAASGGGGAASLDDLSDVAITSAAPGHILVRDGTGFANVVQASLRHLAPTGATYETVPRWILVGNNAVIVSQRVGAIGINLPKGFVVNSITFVSAATALNTGVHQYFGLYDNSASPARLAVTNNDTSAAWPANTAKTLNLTSPFTTTYTGLHYLAVLVQATTVPTLLGSWDNVHAAGQALAPWPQWVCNTGQTSLPNPITLSSKQAFHTYAYVA